MSKRNILSIAEYVFVGASVIGLLVAVEFNKSSFYAIVPLTGTHVLNLLNRQKQDKITKKDTVNELTDIEQRLLNKIQWLEDSFKALPPPIEPAYLKRLEEKSQSNTEAIGKIQNRLSSLNSLDDTLSEMGNNLNRLEEKVKENIETIKETQQTIKSLPTRTDLELQTQEAFKIISSKQKITEDELAQITEEINVLSARSGGNFSAPDDVGEIENNISNLNQQIDRLSQQVNDRLEVGEIESLKTTLESRITRSDLNIFTEDLKALKKQTQNLKATTEELQTAFRGIASIEEIISETGDSDLISELKELRSIKEDLADLKSQFSLMEDRTDSEDLVNASEGKTKTNKDNAPKRNIFNWLSGKF